MVEVKGRVLVELEVLVTLKEAVIKIKALVELEAEAVVLVEVDV